MTPKTHALMFFYLITTFFCLISPEIKAEGPSVKLFPAPLVYLDPALTHHVLVAEKATHKLYLYENDKSYPKLIKVYDMATGKKAGNKIFEGDHRTPEGIYFLNSFIPNEELLARYGEAGKIYGVGAFVLDYPNAIDRKQQKSGGGIWLHSTNDETRIEKGLDSRGCFVVKNNDLKEISTYIELSKTVFISMHEIPFLSEENWITTRIAIKTLVDTWLESWRNEDIESYISNYHPVEFYDNFRGNYTNFKAYKRAVFAGAGTPQIQLSNLSIVASKDYVVVTFLQNYKSNSIQDTGHKTLYLKQDEYYNWKIVSENWRKVENPEQYVLDFRPSMRFFDTNGTVAQWKIKN